MHTDLRKELTGKIEKVDAKVDSVRTELTDRIDGLDAKIDSVKESLASAKIWAVMLYVALAGSLFFALAKGFRWI